MRLYIVRHGKATEQPSPLPAYKRPEGYPDDFDRPLTDRGAAQARYLGAELKTAEPPVGLILTSRYPRAMQSAEIIRASLGAELKTAGELEVDHPVSEVLKLIEEHRGLRAMMIVGHNPQLGELISVLAKGLPPEQLMLRTGELVGIELRPNQGVGSGRVIVRLRLGDEASHGAAINIVSGVVRGA